MPGIPEIASVLRKATFGWLFLFRDGKRQALKGSGSAQVQHAKKPPEGGIFPCREGVVHIMGWKAHETSVFSDLKFEVPPKVPPGRSALLLQLLKLIAQ
jgi:hypothetical protein